MSGTTTSPMIKHPFSSCAKNDRKGKAQVDIDVSDKILAGYAALPTGDMKRVPSTAPPDLHPQAAEMFVWMAAHAVGHVERGSAGYLDVTVPVTGLTLTSCLVTCERSGYTPDFSRPRRPDLWVRSEFSGQLMAELNREQHARLQEGVWRCWYDPQADIAHQRLTRRRRLSALTLLDARAKAALFQFVTGKPLDGLSPDEVYHAMASSPEMLYFLTHTDPAGWSQFEAAMGTTAFELAALAGFMEFLNFAEEVVNHSFWYDDAFLLTLWKIHVKAFPQYAAIQEAKLLVASHAFSMTPTEASASLMHPPFYRLHGKLLRNPCFLLAHDPIASLLTIAIRRHERVWNNTLGSTLARAADTLASMLAPVSRLEVAVRRNFPGGDVDLALYDTVSHELLICEVKTVYDKHRADSLMSRFEKAKVNVDRACSQLTSTENVIASGQLTMSGLFGKRLPAPASVHKALLTWLDPVDLTMGTPHEAIMSLNFALFLCLVHTSRGDIPAMTKAVHELRNLWPVARRRALDLGQPELNADVEVQMSLLDARDSLAQLPLCELTRKVVAELGSVSDDNTLRESGGAIVSYLADTRAFLGLL